MNVSLTNKQALHVGMRLLQHYSMIAQVHHSSTLL